MSKTFRRDKLRRMVEAGRLEVVESYHFDDMDGATYNTAKGMPAALAPKDWHDRKEGVCYLFPSDFNSSCGYAYQSENGLISLYVHSNSNYTFREIKPGRHAHIALIPCDHKRDDALVQCSVCGQMFERVCIICTARREPCN